MAGLFKGKGFTAENTFKFIVVTLVLAFFVGKYVVPFLSPLFGGGTPDFSVIENIDLLLVFGVIFIALIATFVIGVMMKEKITGKSIGIALLLGVGVYYAIQYFPGLFDWLKQAIVTPQVIILP